MSRYMPARGLALLLLATLTSAQSVLESVSFGQRTPLSHDGNAPSGWVMGGENHDIQVLSDRLVLTPPVPGNTRGAIWAVKSVPDDTWTLDFEFRASGQDQGTGNLNIWFVKDKNQVNTHSVYTINNFDGFVLVIDQYGNTGGKVRGFLNDGTQFFKVHNSLESLAFGHCDYAYRNLGRPSKLRITNQNGLMVSVDDRECFSSDRISLPADYFFGVTAATSDNPDSFEIQKFIVSSPSGSSAQRDSEHLLRREQQQAQKVSPLQRLERLPVIPDKAAEEVKGADQQFADLHDRIQAIAHEVSIVSSNVDTLRMTLEAQHKQILHVLSSAGGDGKADSAAGSSGRSKEADIMILSHKLERIEKVIERVQREVEGRDYKDHINELRMSLESLRGGLTEHLPETMRTLVKGHAPRMGLFVAVVVAVQIMLAGAYVVYKRRRDTMPKKYL